MSSASRAAMRGSAGGSFLVSLGIGSILIVVGLFSQVERYKALSIITGITIILRPIIVFFATPVPTQLTAEEKLRAEKLKLQKLWKKKNVARLLFIFSLIATSVIGFIASYSFLFPLGIFVLIISAALWYNWYSQWDKLHVKLLHEIYNDTPREELTEEKDKLHTRWKVYLALWLSMWAMNWILLFSELNVILDEAIFYLLFAISFSGFPFFMLTNNTNTYYNRLKIVLSK